MASDATGTIIGSMAATMVVAQIAADPEDDRFVPIAGAGIATVILLGVAMWSPQVASGVAVLVFIAALTANSRGALRWVQNLIGDPPLTNLPEPPSR